MELMNKVQVLIICLLLKEFRMKEFKKCPTRCRCIYEEDLRVLCIGINDSGLQTANNELAEDQIGLFLLNFSELGNITNGTFSKIKAKSVLIRDVKVDLFDFFGGFHGMQDTLKILRIEGVTANKWLFSSGEGFHKLGTFFLEMDFDEEFAADPFIRHLPRNMTEIFIQDCVIQSPEKSSFARFSNLRVLRLIWNRLTSFKRNLLPRPALQLEILSFQGNPIVSLPDDMFVEMPALQTIILDETKLTILSYPVFAPVFRQLSMLQITGIKLVCDCDVAWLLKHESLWNSHTLYADCNEPPSLKNTRLDTLMPIDLCYDCSEEIQVEDTNFDPNE